MRPAWDALVRGEGCPLCRDLPKTDRSDQWGYTVADLTLIPREEFARAVKGRTQLPVIATGRLQTGNGIGRFELESATVGGVPIPKLLLQEIVGYYSRSAQNPSGFNIDDPFSLPARIREIQVERGQAIIVQ